MAVPHTISVPKNDPLIAVNLHILTWNILGGIKTNVNGQVLSEDDAMIEALDAAGEATDFGGGGIHGYRALEGIYFGV